MDDEKNLKLVNLYESILQLDEDIIYAMSKHKSQLLELLTIDEVATIILLANNDIDMIKDKIRIVKDKLPSVEEEKKFRIVEAYG